MHTNQLMIAASHSGAGKTTITLGIMSALRRRGLSVQPFKVGPDYLDTTWHKAATGLISRNLDPFIMGESGCDYSFTHHSNQADFSIIEGVMGLYDGYGEDPFYCSSAGLAKALSCPIILVVDGKGVSTSIAATVLGFLKFDHDTPIRGVIFNRVNSDHHLSLLKNAVEKYCNLPVLGRLPKIDTLAIPSRHLGLAPAAELDHLSDYFDQLSQKIETYIDLDALIKISSSPSPSTPPRHAFASLTNQYSGLKMALAVDDAFHFYYEDNLDLIRALGVEIIPFSPLSSNALPDCDLIYIGGGFPENFAADLANNNDIKAALHQAHQNEIPIYAECGGLMYLGDYFIDFDGKKHDMVGILEGYSQMTQGLKRFGYCQGEGKANTLLGQKGIILKGHEFHHSDFFTQLPSKFTMQKVQSGKVIRQWEGGYQLKNTLATYLHIHFYQNPEHLYQWLMCAKLRKARIFGEMSR